LNNNTRISELDWLRVILIVAVFCHHVFMPFNGDKWHIMNSESSKLLDDIMVYFEQLRLPTLFFISGVGSVLLLNKIKASQFLRDKLLRLFVPLLVGVLFIVPPQTYIEHIAEYGSYWQALPSVMLKFETNHLWFIKYLLVFAVLAIPLHLFLQSSIANQLKLTLEKLSSYSSGLFSLVILLIAFYVTLKIYFPKDDHKITNLSSSLFYLFFFIAGMVFIQSQQVWSALGKYRRTNLIWLVISSLIFYGYYFSPDLSAYISKQTSWSIWWLVCSLVTWSAMLTFLGYAQVYLTSTPAWLKKSNELIYPFYIFHQTVIVVLGYFVISWNMSIALKATILLLSAFVITTGLCLLLVSPFNI
jgi:glucan biosynthesis protein C